MKVKGFTLIELLIAVAIVAILAAIAVPIYQDQVDRTRRADAQTGLMDMAQQMERCFTRFNSYSAAGCPDSEVAHETQDGFYDIRIRAGTTTYELVATPKGIQASRDGTKCSEFRLNQVGERTATGTDGDECWN